MPATSDSVRVEGLVQFQRSLKALDREYPKALRLALNDSADIIVRDARPRVAHRSGDAASTVRAKSTQRSARVSGGGSKAPYYPWLDFGGRVGRRHSVVRPFLPQGRYIYNAYFRRREQFVDELGVRLRTVAEGAGLEVH